MTPGGLDRASLRAWIILLAVSLLTVGAVEVVLLALTTGFFTNGYNGISITGLGAYVQFAFASFAVDLCLVLGLWALLIPTLRRLGATRLQLPVAALAVGVGVPLLIAGIRRDLHSVLGDMVRLSVLQDASSGGDSMAQAFELAAASDLFPVAGFVAALTIGLTIARRIELKHGLQGPRPPSTGLLVALFAASGALAIFVLATPTQSLQIIDFGLRQKASVTVLRGAADRLTDVDFDGFGAVARPRDHAPLDPGRHPYALDLPGNGVDENGIGGDRPLRSVTATDSSHAPLGPGSRHVLFILLESFRYDLLGARIAGREVTPFLNRLVREGASCESYVHSPSTLPGRAQFFTGAIVFDRSAPTLIDDFLARDYRVGWFSGQSDAYGDTDRWIGTERAEVFYDARQDKARRTSRSTATVSLQVSADTLLEHALPFLETQDPERPLFLYLNFVDTHFPYTHDEVGSPMHVAPFARDDIREENAETVWAAYANTAAYVDGAVERAVRAAWQKLGRENVSLVVTADHGQAFYEKGFLGHAQDVDDLQTRVPLLLDGFDGVWPEPVANSDLRQLIAAHLPERGASPVAQCQADPGRSVLLYASKLETPRVIGLRSHDGLVRYDLEAGRGDLTDPAGRPREVSEEARARALDALVHRWEARQAGLVGSGGTLHDR